MVWILLNKAHWGKKTCHKKCSPGKSGMYANIYQRGRVKVEKAI